MLSPFLFWQLTSNSLIYPSTCCLKIEERLFQNCWLRLGLICTLQSSLDVYIEVCNVSFFVPVTYVMSLGTVILMNSIKTSSVWVSVMQWFPTGCRGTLAYPGKVLVCHQLLKLTKFYQQKCCQGCRKFCWELLDCNDPSPKACHPLNESCITQN